MWRWRRRIDGWALVPASEPGAGSQIDMLLLNEETVQLTRKGQAAPEIWRRCKPTS